MIANFLQQTSKNILLLMYKRKYCMRLIAMLFLAFSTTLGGYAQGGMPDISQIDFRTIRVDEMSDQQLRQFVNRAQTTGMSMQELEAVALDRGMPFAEVVKLRNRIANLPQETQTHGTRQQTGRTQLQSELLSIPPDTLLPHRREGLEVFGTGLFRREKLSFEPSLNIPTPRNYIIGPGDELLVEVWGASQQTYTLPVSPEGQVRIANLGLVRVGGLSVEQASELIISRLSGIYSGMRGANPNTFAQVSLGNVRSIKVTIAGDAFMPGTFTLPAFATVFNALYYAGGPSQKGSFRNIQVIRNGRNIANLDLYSFLLKGETELNIRLQDEDLIFIGPYANRVHFSGEIKRPAIYELRQGETLADLILFAGGFSANAFTRHLQVDRPTENQRRLLNVERDLFSSFLVHNGDRIEVGPLLETYENRVSIRGAVYREGEYALSEGMGIRQLLALAEGLREDAFSQRAALYRLRDNRQLEVVDINLDAILNGQSPDVSLQREDLLVISSVLELEQERKVRIYGEVQQTGDYPWARGMSLGELIRKSGGLTDAASLARVEVARRVSNRNSVAPQQKITEVFSFAIDPDLGLQDEAGSFQLEAFDMIFVRRSPGYQTQKLVQLRGEIVFPGSYAMGRKDERISEIIARAGGLTPEAYIPGATLRRRASYDEQERARRMALLEATGVEILTDTLQSDYQHIGINLERILNNPGSRHDLILMEGDILEIPLLLQTVSMSGAVLHPVTMTYRPNAGVRRYISGAGGFADNARRNKVYVIYPNGSVDRTRNFVLFNSYPNVEPGSEIVVPLKPERQQRSLQETIAISSAITSLALVIVTLINQF